MPTPRTWLRLLPFAALAVVMASGAAAAALGDACFANANCADGTICTRGDACAAGVCVPGPAVACDDGDACSEEHCDPLYGCVFHEEAVGLPCLPSCEGAVADYTPCPGDDDVCTLDACLPSV